MSNPLILWIKELFGLWVKLMCSMIGLALQILGWFFIPEMPRLRPFIIGAGALALLASSYLAWLSQRKQLEELKGKLPIIQLGEAIEFDETSSVYRLPVRNEGKIASKITAKLERVVMGDGQPHPDSARLPIKLQWMHHPRIDSPELGAEKVDIVFVKSPPLSPPPPQLGQPRFIAANWLPVSQLPEPPEMPAPPPYLMVAGVTFDGFKISPQEGQSVYCELAFYGSENVALVKTWCHFKRNAKAGLAAEIIQDSPFPDTILN